MVSVLYAVPSVNGGKHCVCIAYTGPRVVAYRKMFFDGGGGGGLQFFEGHRTQFPAQNIPLGWGAKNKGASPPHSYVTALHLYTCFLVLLQGLRHRKKFWGGGGGGGGAQHKL